MILHNVTLSKLNNSPVFQIYCCLFIYVLRTLENKKNTKHTATI